MILCHCNAIREAEVRAVARDCGGCVHNAYARLGCEVQCGGCVETAEELIAECAAPDVRELLAA